MTRVELPRSDRTKPRVVILTPTSNRSAGGVERFSSLLVELLSDDFEVALEEAPVVRGRWLERLGIAPIFRARRSRDALERLEPDILITNGTLGAVGPGPWKHVHVYHGTLPSHSFADRSGRRLRDWFLAGTLGGGLCEFLSGVRATRVAVSNSAADEVRRHYRFARPVVIENGVRSVETSQNSARRLILFVGRRESRKGYETAVLAANLSGDRLTVAGAGSDARTDDLGLLSEEGVSSALGESRALVLPTRYEACSLAILEALSIGCPVVTTPVGWVKDLVRAVPAYSSLLVPPDDADAIAEVLRRLGAGDPSLWQAVADAQNLVRSQNSLKVFRDQWIRLLRAEG